MKTRHSPRNSRRKGYSTLLMVSAVSILVLGMMAFNIRGNIRTTASQARAQVKQDYNQKEEAILNALLHIVPNKAIGAMRQGSASNSNFYTWETIFREALTAANAERAVSPELLNSLNLGSAISANTGDSPINDVSQFVRAPVGTFDGSNSLVNGGNWWEYLMLGDTKIGPRVPAALQLSYSDYLLDKRYPIVSLDKQYVASYTKGLGLSPNAHPLYNLLQYPDVQFGYKKPGESFVAKRNWWVFSLYFGSQNQAVTGIPPVRRDYVLSLYEIPSQVPLSAATLMKVGKFADGTSWENVDLDGSLVADRLETEGTVVVNNGAVSARKTLTLSGSTVVDGTAVQQNFDDLGEREARAATSDNSDFYQASVAGNVGKVAFIPINRGTETLLNTPDGDRSNRISPTGWNYYSQAAPKAAMSLEIRKMSSSTQQIPTEILLRYRSSSNTVLTRTLTRGSNWPTDLESGGTLIPFQTGVLDNDRTALILHMDRLTAYVNGLPSSGGMSRNHSLYIFPRTGESTVIEPSVPSVETDMAVSMRGGRDLRNYTAGFALVSRYRVYVAETLNDVPVAAPANSGLPSGYVFYPPLSIFAPEKRFGESLAVQHPIQMNGQLNSLKTGTNETVNPLELMSANDMRLDATKIDANLTSLKSPAELSPIHMMNWMLTIEPIH